ncbi:MAG: tRNA (guanosine(46)-N7)-methyltransferase TrmB [Gammaproteobacteria bacterium]|nr:tRNA (guanosine(46)-N7)-methyltransferase TrmB [Gammaproteobacteria bacterium]MCW8910457.1 tRNA (guanosine(46)-N7)-methyltransferase TrmB [Gammaproteobacteria bacterium]MCW9004963.1 tRNA (guanosine(46)-N7)-methyltransferase TrmB [Gammaproteobacteria bacterium]MCW9056940.1 tRNA (guanosine(46)-N7)-methyltransferase TrmB [Gammaproteobacteria bacterium]
MESKHFRTIRSFVKREGRLTAGQQRALDVLWPEFGIDYSTDILDFTQLFDRPAPVVLEIGFGNGDSLFQMAQNYPDRNYIGIEVHRPGVGHLLQLIETHNLKNLKIICHDAVDVIEHQIADNSLDRVQLFFPDPWHKKKHNKRRIVQEKFINLLAKKIKTDGFLHMATDWQDYAEHMLEVLMKNSNFKNTSTENAYVPRPNDRPVTKFEKRGHRLGHGVWDLLFKRI